MKDSTMRDAASAAKEISGTGREVLEALREEKPSMRGAKIGAAVGGAVGGIPGALIGVVAGGIGGAVYDWWNGN